MVQAECVSCVVYEKRTICNAILQTEWAARHFLSRVRYPLGADSSCTVEVPYQYRRSSLFMEHSSEQLSNRAALITGSSGIAAATARLFHQEGARIAVVDRAAENLEALTNVLPDVLTITADLVEEGAAKRVVAAAREHFGRLDILVNIA